METNEGYKMDEHVEKTRKEIVFAIEAFRVEMQERLDTMVKEFGIVPIIQQDLCIEIGEYFPSGSSLNIKSLQFVGSK